MSGSMTDVVQEMGGAQVMVCAADGPPLSGEAEAIDLIGNASYRGASWVAVPVGRLDGDFFTLRTGLAGAVAQKFANYRMGLAVVGDVSAHVAASTALRDLVRESNRGRSLWFASDMEELKTRLASHNIRRVSNPENGVSL
ncbi:DUF4180 domain-containing protein [Nocardiopsis sp. CT-R113]|uniref:DUF4180 domain-containing protein n=1 Tax=Nocardiopsis codii TaxID=3065942 RepID=A0ABU7K443_9ACTN|nr:DUF4180 domain-containing protein [Nocardiopsis sp. CT-R113]MEE2037007.1 DUF4180 domain-containing protein [Nocardiopsis sp. CT-R113]